MAGANSTSSVGAGFVIDNDAEPNFTIKTVNSRHYVCVRETSYWKEIIAEFADFEHARWFIDFLNKEGSHV